MEINKIKTWKIWEWKDVLLSFFIMAITICLASAEAVPTASFTYQWNGGLACEANTIQFTNTSSTQSGSIVFTIWDFGDGESSSVSSPGHVYESPGTYTVELTVQDSNGDFASTNQSITVNPIPDSDFAMDGQTADQCVSTTQIFENLTTLPAGSISYSWDFGDGNASTDTDPEHGFSTSGTYTITLTSTADATGCASKHTDELTIDPDPVVAFGHTDQCDGSAVQFLNSTSISDGNVSFQWDFGDGNSSSSINPNYTYSTDGVYTVSLEASSARGCTGTLSRSVNIFPQPEAGFSFENECLGTSISFTNNTSVSTGTPQYQWDFGDGHTSDEASPSNDFASSGTYTVTLTSTMADGCSDTFTSAVTVYPVPEASFDVPDVCLGTEVQFVNTSQITSGVVSYQWDFGDGNAGTSENPGHIYANEGEYTVTLTATSEHDCQDSFISTVEVFEASSGGNVDGGTSHCLGDEADGSLTLSDHIGEIVRWERSTSGTDQWLTIDNQKTTLDYSDLQETTHFRAVAQNGVCSEAISSIAAIQVDAPSGGGVISEDASVCDAGNSGSLTLSDHLGDVVRWQQSTSSSGPWTDIANTTVNQLYADLIQTTYYRAEVKNGVCARAFSKVAEIKVFPNTVPGLLQGSATVCKNDNSGTLTLTDHTGDILRWETSSLDEDSWLTIANTNTTHTYSDLLRSARFRVVVQSGPCDVLVSNEVKVQVDEPSVAGELTGPVNVCEIENDGILQLEQHNGVVQQWESSTDEITWSGLDNSGATLEFDDLLESTYYRVIVKNGVCDRDTSSHYLVNVHPLPEPAFSVDEVCLGEKSEFVNNSIMESGTIERYSWNFSNGTGSQHSDPVIQFDASGSHSVSLVVTSDQGCVDSTRTVAVVHPNPVSKFRVTDTCLGDSTIFTSASTISSGSIASSHWAFGDGNSFVSGSADHLYENVGTYEVNLEVTSEDGCMDSSDQEVHVDPNPAASFEAPDVCDGSTVQFSNHSSISTGNMSFTWNFGDDSLATVINPQHKYEAPGVYTVNLEAESDRGCRTSIQSTVEVFEQPIASFQIEDICLDSVAVFSNGVSGEGLQYVWSFGDGGESTEFNPTHHYTSPGTYPVSLAIEHEESGCGDRISKPIKVYPLPQLRVTSDVVCEGHRTTFTNASGISSGSTSYLWAFGDGSNSGEVAPRHLYDSAGKFNVILRGTTDFGWVSLLDQEVVVSPNPVPDFVVPDVCDGEISRFENRTTIGSGSVSFIWDFGDQTNSILESPEKQYLNAGAYVVRLMATSDRNCKAEISKTAVVHEVPIAAFEVENVCYGETVFTNNKSVIPQSTEVGFSWNFGDIRTSSARNSSHTFADAGVYSIDLSIQSAEGCVDSVSRPVIVYDLPIVSAGTDTTLSQGYSARLSATGGEQFVWSPVTGLDNSNIPDPIARPLVTTDYAVLATDEYGCQNTDTVRVSIVEDFVVVANNVFTPDGNGANDTWIIENVETFGTVNVRVFDRYGKIVFQDETYQNDWSGTIGKDILPDGTYYYLITFSDSDVQYKGSLTIIRNR